MDRKAIFRDVAATLNKTGFFMNADVSIQNPIFDIVARRDDDLFLIKVLENIDAFNKERAQVLLSISTVLKAVPLVVGHHSCNRKLEDGVLYERYGVTIVNENTLMEFLYEGAPPLVFAGPGGYYASIDGGTMRETRISKGLSLKDVSRKLGVSVRTVQMYEEGMSASVDIAADIEELLEAEIVKPLDIFSKPSPPEEAERPEFAVPKGELHKLIYLTFREVGYDVLPVVKCPFEALTSDKKERMITGIKADKCTKVVLTKRARIISSLSDVTESESVIFILDRMRDMPDNLEGIPIIGKNEMDKIEDPGSLIDLIYDRRE